MFRDFLGFFRSESKESKSNEAQIEERASSKVAEIKDDQPRNPYNEIQILAGHSDHVHLLVRIDETRVLTASHDNTAAIWNIVNGCLLFKIEGHTKPINCVLTLSSDATLEQDDDDDDFEDDMRRVLLTASFDKTIQLWNLSDGSNERVITDHDHVVTCLIPLKDDDDDAMYCAGGDHLSLWDQKMRLLHVYQSDSGNYIKSLLSIKDRKIIASTDNSKLFYTVVKSGEEVELQLLRKLPPHREAITCLINISDAMFASASLDGTIMIWTTYHLFPTRQFNFHDVYVDANRNAFKFNVNHLFALEQRYVFASVANGFHVFDTISDSCLVRHPNAHYEDINQMTLLSDGTILATCSVDGTVRLWGAPSPVSSDEIVERKRATTPLERLIGKRMKNVQQAPACLELIGECAAHSSSIQFVLSCGKEGFLSCGSDNMIILWKDGRMQSERRNQHVREIIQQTGQFSF